MGLENHVAGSRLLEMRKLTRNKLGSERRDRIFLTSFSNATTNDVKCESEQVAAVLTATGRIAADT